MFVFSKEAVSPKARSHGKKRKFGPKFELSGPKRRALLGSNHVLATTGKSCANKKVPSFQINISHSSDFGCCFGRKRRIFGPKK